MKTEMKIEENVYIAEDATVKGNVTMGTQCSVWNHATIRSDRSPITIGQGTNIQDNAVIHVEKEYDVVIGDYVTVGHSAIVHGCHVGSGTLVGMGAIVMNGAKIGRNCIIGAGALIPEGKEIEDGSLVLGMPGRVIRKLTPEEIEKNKENAIMYIKEAEEYKKQQNCDKV